MIDTALVEQPVNEEDFSYLPSDMFPMLFLGFSIRNEYDNRRLHFSEKYNPLKFFHVINTSTEESVAVIPFYGINLKPNAMIKELIKALQTQRSLGNISLAVYKNIISQYDISCENTYTYFCDGCYPLDFKNLKDVCVDSIKDDKKILQHILSIDEKVFDFQQFASLKLFILL